MNNILEFETNYSGLSGNANSYSIQEIAIRQREEFEQSDRLKQFYEIRAKLQEFGYDITEIATRVLGTINLFTYNDIGNLIIDEESIKAGYIAPIEDIAMVDYKNKIFERHYLTLIHTGEVFAKMLVNGGLADDSTFEQCFEVVLHTLTEYENISPQAVLQAKAFLKEYIAELDKDFLRRLNDRTDRDFYTEL